MLERLRKDPGFLLMLGVIAFFIYVFYLFITL